MVGVLGVGRVREADSNGRFEVNDVGLAIPGVRVERERLSIRVGAEGTVLSEETQKGRGARSCEYRTC